MAAAVEGVRHRTVEANGVRLHVAEAGPEGGGAAPAVLLLHGFPDLWYGWRHQMAALAARGYRAVAPDLRGYGDSDTPPDASAYTTFHAVGDLVALIADLGQPQVSRWQRQPVRFLAHRSCEAAQRLDVDFCFSFLDWVLCYAAGVRRGARLGRHRGVAAVPPPAGPGAGAREPQRCLPTAAAGEEPAPEHQGRLRGRPLHVPLPGTWSC